jgi:protein-tyrosine phosphatase
VVGNLVRRRTRQEALGAGHALLLTTIRSAPALTFAVPVIDLHCHVLSGIDDGPATIDGSVALARAAAADGTRLLVATPHVNSRYPNEPEPIARGVEELNMRLAAEGIALEVRSGAELAMTRLVEMQATQIQRFALGGGEWLLVECPLSSASTGFDILVLDLQRRGHRVLLAHPERCPAFHREPHMLGSLVSAGALTSITAGALVGRFGGEVRRFALRLVRDGMAHSVASDAHDPVRRPPTMKVDLEAAELGPLAHWLTEAVPSAILEGHEIPPQPSVVIPAVEQASRSRWHLPHR